MPYSSDAPASRILVFDLDDTLYLERDFVLSGFAAVEAHLEAVHGSAVINGTCRHLFEQGVRGQVFDRALERFGIAADPATISELIEVYRGHAPEIAPCSDALELLGSDRNRRAIITDGPAAMQRSKIAALGIADEFDLIVLTGDLSEGMGKPHPRAFEHVMAWSGELSSTHVYIADNPAKDFIAPRLLGWSTVQIDRPGRIHSPDTDIADHAPEIRIETLSELATVLNLPR